MKPILTTILLLFSIAAKTQTYTDSIPVRLNNLRLPDFKLLLLDSSTNFYSEQLSKNKSSILISFSPDCHHCINQTKEILAQIRKLKSVQIVMASTFPFNMIKDFYNTYHIAKYKNIIMGRDVLYFFPKYYQNHSLPLITVYNKKGKLLHYFDGGLPTYKLIELVTKIR